VCSEDLITALLAWKNPSTEDMKSYKMKAGTWPCVLQMEAHSPSRRKELSIITGDAIAEEVNQEGVYFFENDEREPATADTNEARHHHL
jgi:hypothetical protein